MAQRLTDVLLKMRPWGSSRDPQNSNNPLDVLPAMISTRAIQQHIFCLKNAQGKDREAIDHLLVAF